VRQISFRCLTTLVLLEEYNACVLVWPEVFNTLVFSWQGEHKIQEEQDDSDVTKEDFPEAMHTVFFSNHIVCFMRIIHICLMDEAVFTASLRTLLHLTS
jgi:hypothetical protein